MDSGGDGSVEWSEFKKHQRIIVNKQTAVKTYAETLLGDDKVRSTCHSIAFHYNASDIPSDMTLQATFHDIIFHSIPLQYRGAARRPHSS